MRSKMNSGKKPTIPQVFQGQSILVSGATGFVGKLLLEKLLRCCPGVARIYLIVRSKRGHSMKQRMKDLLGHSLFDRCRAERGDINWCCGAAEVAAKRDDAKGPLVVGISGDVSEEGLGLDDKDRSHLELHVTVVFHSAATVRFNEPLRHAVRLNCFGTKGMLDLASRMPLLKAFLHVSTAYAHVSNHDTTIGEKFYSVPIEPEDVLKATEELGDEEYGAFSKKLEAVYQNTYLCTKALAERIIEKNYSHLPISVYRPGIVGAVHTSPTPGWIEGYQGPAIVIYSSSSGLIQLVNCLDKIRPEVVPVDHVVNAMLTVVWAKMIDRPNNNTANGMNKDITIFNHVSSGHSDFTWGKFKLYSNRALKMNEELSRMREINFTSSLAVYEVKSHMRFFYYMLLDAANSIFGKDSHGAIELKKAKSAVDSVSYFMLNQFAFSDDRLTNLREKYAVEVGTDGSGYDSSEYDFNIKILQWDDYVRSFCDSLRKNLLKSHSVKMEKLLKNADKFDMFERSMTMASGILLSCASLYYLGMF